MPTRTSKASTRTRAKAAAKPKPKAATSDAPPHEPRRPSTMLAPGDAAPRVGFVDHAGNKHTLASFAGKMVVVSFFVKPSTPSCTTQVCELAPLARGSGDEPEVVVLAVGPGTPRTHATFASTVAGKAGKNDALLIIDEAKQAGGVSAPPALAEAFGAWGAKQMYGKAYMGVLRSTFIIGPQSTVLQVWPNVRVKGHAQEVATWLAKHASHGASGRAKGGTTRRVERP